LDEDLHLLPLLAQDHVAREEEADIGLGFQGPHLGDGAHKPLLQGEAFHGYPPPVFYREVQERSRFIRSKVSLSISPRA
jgi:hypothetical protein